MRTQISLTNEEYAAAKREARRLGISWSDHLRYWMILAKEAGNQSGYFGRGGHA